MAISMVRAFQTRDHFALGFSVTGCIWLITWLGFAIDTPQSSTNLNVPWKMAAIINYQRDLSELRVLRESGVHSHLQTLYNTQPMTEGDAAFAAVAVNGMRLGICLSALVVGMAGGAIFKLANWKLNKPDQRRTNIA